MIHIIFMIPLNISPNKFNITPRRNYAQLSCSFEGSNFSLTSYCCL